MIPLEPLPKEQENRPAGACWCRIGVAGDRSCPALAEVGHCHNCPVFSDAGQALFQREAPPDYLQLWTRQLAEIETPAIADAVSLLIFRIGPEWLALKVASVVEVIAPRTIHRVPHRSNRLLLGLANIRGELQLCISLRDLLGIEVPQDPETQPSASADARPRMIVAQNASSCWVFPVDEVEGVHRIPSSSMENLPYTVQRSPRYYTQGLFMHRDRRVGALATDRLFQALEKTVR